MLPNLIGKALVFETNVPENSKLNGQLLWIALEIASQFMQKDWRNNLLFKEKPSSVCLILHEFVIDKLKSTAVQSKDFEKIRFLASLGEKNTEGRGDDADLITNNTEGCFVLYKFDKFCK